MEVYNNLIKISKVRKVTYFEMRNWLVKNACNLVIENENNIVLNKKDAEYIISEIEKMYPKFFKDKMNTLYLKLFGLYMRLNKKYNNDFEDKQDLYSIIDKFFPNEKEYKKVLNGLKEIQFSKEFFANYFSNHINRDNIFEEYREALELFNRDLEESIYSNDERDRYYLFYIIKNLEKLLEYDDDEKVIDLYKKDVLSKYQPEVNKNGSLYLDYLSHLYCLAHGISLTELEKKTLFAELTVLEREKMISINKNTNKR